MKVSEPTVKRWGNAFSVVVFVIALMLFLIASVKVISYLVYAEGTVESYMSKSCSQSEQSGLEAKWEYGEGCLVNIDVDGCRSEKSQNKGPGRRGAAVQLKLPLHTTTALIAPTQRGRALQLAAADAVRAISSAILLSDIQHRRERPLQQTVE